MLIAGAAAHEPFNTMSGQWLASDGDTGSALGQRPEPLRFFISKDRRTYLPQHRARFSPFLHNRDNIATEGTPKPGICPTLISNDFKSSL